MAGLRTQEFSQLEPAMVGLRTPGVHTVGACSGLRTPGVLTVGARYGRASNPRSSHSWSPLWSGFEPRSSHSGNPLWSSFEPQEFSQLESAMVGLRTPGVLTAGTRYGRASNPRSSHSWSPLWSGFEPQEFTQREPAVVGLRTPGVLIVVSPALYYWPLFLLGVWFVDSVSFELEWRPQRIRVHYWLDDRHGSINSSLHYTNTW